MDINLARIPIKESEEKVEKISSVISSRKKVLIPSLTIDQMAKIDRAVEMMAKADIDDLLTFYMRNHGWKDWSDWFGPKFKIEVFRYVTYIEVQISCVRNSSRFVAWIEVN